jgi:hypothetical protein
VALGCAYARAGRREDAEWVAATTAENPGAVSEAEIFACLGDKEHVFKVLNEHASTGPIRMGWVLNRVDRQHRGLLQRDPRLSALRTMIRSDIRAHAPSAVPIITSLLKGDVIFTTFEATILDEKKATNTSNDRFSSRPSPCCWPASADASRRISAPGC